MINKVDIGSDDFITGSAFVKLGNVASAIGKVLLANGSPNKFQAERDAWLFIHTGIVAGKLYPLAPETLNVLSINEYGNGVVGFDELVEWGLWCHRFDFVKESVSLASKNDVRLSVTDQQTNAILNYLKEHNYDPLKLPVPPLGKAGVKKDCCDSLCKNNKTLFSSKSVFKTAWDRLRANSKIIDAK